MSISNRRGNVLLFVIAGIAMIASIAMGMFYMTSTSSLGQAGGSGMNRAYYLALAGKNYALANWNNKSTNEFILSTTEQFSIVVNPSNSDDVTSTGIVNKDTSFEARKTITVSPPSSAKRHFLDTFEDLTKWATGTQVGGHAIATVSGDKALDVTSTQSGVFGSYGIWSLLRLNAGVAGVDFSTSWLDAGRCLSHDLQVKIANDQPYYDQKYYFAGLIFKAANAGNEFYGVSFMRTKQRCWGVWGCSSQSGWNGSTWNSCYCGSCERADNIPSELKPTNVTGTDGIFTEPLECWTDGWDWFRYSRPAIVLWKRQGGAFTWLAYKILSGSDFVVDGSNKLVDWSNLQVRLIEAKPLGFSNGGPEPLLHNAVVKGANSGARARISGTPIMTSGTWPSSTASGTLTLTSISGTFQNGENLLVNGVTSARVSGTIGNKMNFIRVYYGDMNPSHTPDPNNIPTDNNRALTARVTTGSGNVIHWPVDNISDWDASNDNMTLVQWADQIGAGATRLGGSGTKEANAIIADSSLLTPDSGTINYSGVALHATGNTATSTYFDDFAIQY